MNKMILPSLFSLLLKQLLTVLQTPRNFAPAIKAPISKEKMVLSFKFSGTSLRTIRCANPSTIAVLPTPGSPIKTGLFLVFLDKIRITSRISSSRPMIGSCFPFYCIKSTPYFSSALYCSSWF